MLGATTYQLRHPLPRYYILGVSRLELRASDTQGMFLSYVVDFSVKKLYAAVKATARLELAAFRLEGERSVH